MKRYIVKFDYRTNWNNQGDIHDDSQWIVTNEDIQTLAEEWGKTYDELLEQVEETA